jgi:peptidoglycan/xylan/chitin deacetylase (PgdA/CDA1 family)
VIEGGFWFSDNVILDQSWSMIFRDKRRRLSQKSCARGEGDIIVGWQTGPIGALWLEFLYFSGSARFAEWWRAGEGVILKFERVRPPRSGSFQPLKPREIAPDRFDRVLTCLRRWNYDIIAIGDLAERLQRPGARPRRFVCLTFDIGYRDFLDHAWPVLQRHDTPATLYVPANFADRLDEPWWLALEAIIARNDRLGLFVAGRELRLACRSASDKIEAFAFLSETLGAMAAADCSAVIRDLCRRYGVDLSALAAQELMSWPEIAHLAADPLLTVGSASLTYPVLSRLDRRQSERELRMGRTVAEGAIGRRVQHLAYPYGTSGTFGRRELMSASELGFATAVTAEPGVVRQGDVEMLALPRVSWDGRRASLRAWRALLSGLSMKTRARQVIAAPEADPSST